MPEDFTIEPGEPTKSAQSEIDQSPDISTTPSGYSYTIVDDHTDVPTRAVGAPRRRWLHIGVTLGVASLAAIVTGVLVWLLAPSAGGSGRLNADVASVLNAFSQGQAGTTTTRYEGELPPGFPGDLPLHAGAKIVSSVGQMQGEDASYIVIWDTGDGRDTVAADYAKLLAADPWQIDRTQDGRDLTLSQFSRIDDPNVTGVVLVTDSKDAKKTMILASVQVVSGAKDATPAPFSISRSRPLPAGFPEELPPYDGATLIESGFQKQSGGTSYAVSYITKDASAGVLDFYRNQLEGANLTVEAGDASQSTLEGAEAIQFTNAQQSLLGGVTVGKFSEDATYTRIDVRVQVSK